MNQNGNNSANDAAMNLALRNMLLASAPRMRKKLGTVTGVVGGTTRQQLFNVGVITKLLLVVTANVTIGGNAIVASPRAPWNCIKQLKLVDFEGNDRVNLSGIQLWQINSVRKRTPAFYNNESKSAVSTLPVVPTGTGTADIKFIIEVPIAYDPESDLRGAILAQTNVGQQFVNVTWNDTFLQDGSDEGVYNSDGAAGTCVVNSISMDVYQDYLMPQPDPRLGGAQPLPLADFLTVYELNGNFRYTDNIANGQERLTAYPNVRTVLAAYTNWTNAGAAANSISRFTLITNGNYVMQEDSLETQLLNQREWINGDLITGFFFANHRSRPIQTALYGNVQVGHTFSASPSGTYFLEQAFESFYAKGAILPGMTNG